MTRSLSAIGVFLGAILASGVAVTGQGVYPFHSAPPVGLNPGDSFRIAFVTNSRMTAVSGDIEDYNNFAQSEANENALLAGLNTTWRAIGSTGAITARENTETDPANGVGEPIYLVDGQSLVASSNADLWDGLLTTPVFLDQDGRMGPQTFDMEGFDLASPGEILTWTGTNPGGDRDLDLGTAPAPFFAVTYGSGDFADSRWIERHGTDFKDRELPLYVLSQPITAVPEPDGLFGLGAAFLAGSGLWRRRSG